MGKFGGILSSLGKSSGKGSTAAGKPASSPSSSSAASGGASGGIGSWLKGAGGTAAGAVRGRAAAAAGAAQAAGTAVAYEAVEQVTGAAKSTSFIIVILGIVQYLLRLWFGPISIVYVFSLALFVLSAYALAAKLEKGKAAILLPMLIFVVWYFIYGGNYEPTFLMYFVSIAIGISLLFALVSKGNSVKPELYGLIPIVFLYLDIGLIPLLVEKMNFSITPLLESLILYMPWWAFLGVMTLPTESSKEGGANFLINVARIGGIMYIVFVLVVVAVPDIGYAKSQLPGTADFEAAQLRVKAQLPQKENPAYSNLMCIFSEPTDTPGCVERRQEASELKYICEKLEKKEPGTNEYDSCLKEQKEEKEKEKLKVAGASDSTIKEPTTAEFKFSQFFPKLTYAAPGENLKVGYPTELEVKNPRLQKFTVQVSCNFTSKGKDKESFPGIIAGGENENTLSVNEMVERNTFVCNPPDGKILNGSYELIYTAKISNLIAASRLGRVFIGKKDEKWKEEWIPKILSAHFSGSTYLSQGAPDFARLNFALGNPAENPIVESGKKVVITSNLENVGGGKITGVSSYHLGLENYFSGADTECIQGDSSNVHIPDTAKSYVKEVIFFPTCTVDVPSVWETVEDYVTAEFKAAAQYDYSLSKEVDIEVKELPT
ncbi:hypothetical protein HZC30_04685 [Candidatus Woesearchaeota archaeon]|nr:hypothetical protein [Candidatus Woesearchaeota archaeon]